MKKIVISLSIAFSVFVSSSVIASENPERKGIGTLPLGTINSLSNGLLGGLFAGLQDLLFGTSAVETQGLDTRRSLIVTDEAILAHFPFSKVMTRLANQSSDPFDTKLKLFNQWWDTANRSPGIGNGAHCDDQRDNRGRSTLNEFPYDCNREEGTQAYQDPFSNVHSDQAYIPIALVNRFDLASLPSQGGADCGEYRIVYARRSGINNLFNRNLVIFEGVLPNPFPNGVNLNGCFPVQEMWAGLTTIDDIQQRAEILKTFYFKGLDGFKPVVKAKHYGNATSKAKGQIRTNQFMQLNWMLREFVLHDDGNGLEFVPVTVKANPYGELFSAFYSHPKKSGFNDDFASQVNSLKISDINRFNMNTLAEKYNTGQSIAPFVGGVDEYDVKAILNLSLHSKIRSRLGWFSPVSSDQIIKRAKALSCAGCHQLSNNEYLGDGMVWPSSLTFTHTSERQKEASPDGGQRYVISQALRNVFLPFRKQVVEHYLDGSLM